MDLEKLRLFVVVVESGSFQKAAQKRYISQRAVSQSIAKLETELNLKLFMRENNKIVITNVGQEFYLKVKDFLHNFDISVRGLQHKEADSYEELKIGYFSPFEGVWLRQQLVEAKRLGIKTHFTVTEESIEHLISDVKMGILDCAFILEYGNYTKIDNELKVKPVYQNQMIMGVSCLSKKAKLHEFPIDELTDKPILYYSSEESHYLKKEFLSSIAMSNSNINLARVSTLEQMQMIVALDQAVAYYPNGLIQMSIKDDGLIKFLPLAVNDDSQDYQISCIYANTSKGKEAKKLLKVIDSVKKE